MPDDLWRTAAETVSSDPVSTLSQYGIAGVILSIFLWFAWQVYSREHERAEANAVEIRRLNDLITREYVPSLERATVALTNANEGQKESAIALAWYEKARDRRHGSS